MDTLFAMLVGLVTFLVVFGVPTLSVLALHFGIVTVIRNVKANGGLRFHGKDRQGIALGIVGVLGLTITVVGFVFLCRALGEAHPKAEMISCSARLKEIGLYMIMYADDNHDVLPRHDDCRRLLGPEGEARDAKEFECPHRGPYRIFVDGQSIAAIKEPSSSIMAACPSPHYNDCVNVLFADGVVKAIESNRAERAIQQAVPGEMPVLE